MYYNIKIKSNKGEYSLDSFDKDIIQREMDLYFASMYQASPEFRSQIKDINFAAKNNVVYKEAEELKTVREQVIETLPNEGYHNSLLNQGLVHFKNEPSNAADVSGPYKFEFQSDYASLQNENVEQAQPIEPNTNIQQDITLQNNPNVAQQQPEIQSQNAANPNLNYQWQNQQQFNPNMQQNAQQTGFAQNAQTPAYYQQPQMPQVDIQPQLQQQLQQQMPQQMPQPELQQQPQPIQPAPQMQQPEFQQPQQPEIQMSQVMQQPEIQPQMQQQMQQPQMRPQQAFEQPQGVQQPQINQPAPQFEQPQGIQQNVQPQVQQPIQQPLQQPVQQPQTLQPELQQPQMAQPEFQPQAQPQMQAQMQPQMAQPEIQLSQVMQQPEIQPQVQPELQPQIQPELQPQQAFEQPQTQPQMQQPEIQSQQVFEQPQAQAPQAVEQPSNGQIIGGQPLEQQNAINNTLEAQAPQAHPDIQSNNTIMPDITLESTPELAQNTLAQTVEPQQVEPQHVEPQNIEAQQVEPQPSESNLVLKMQAEIQAREAKAQQEAQAAGDNSNIIDLEAAQNNPVEINQPQPEIAPAPTQELKPVNNVEINTISDNNESSQEKSLIDELRAEVGSLDITQDTIDGNLLNILDNPEDAPTIEFSSARIASLQKEEDTVPPGFISNADTPQGDSAQDNIIEFDNVERFQTQNIQMPQENNSDVIDFTAYLAGFSPVNIVDKFLICAYYIKNIMHQESFTMKFINSKLFVATGEIADMAVTDELAAKNYITALPSESPQKSYVISPQGEEYTVNSLQIK